MVSGRDLGRHRVLDAMLMPGSAERTSTRIASLREAVFVQGEIDGGFACPVLVLRHGPSGSVRDEVQQRKTVITDRRSASPVLRLPCR